MKTYGGAEIQLHARLMSALDGGERLASSCFRYPSNKKLGGPQGRSGGGYEEKFRPLTESNPDSPVRSRRSFL